MLNRIEKVVRIADLYWNYLDICRLFQEFLSKKSLRAQLHLEAGLCSIPSPVAVAVARDDIPIVISFEKSVEDLHEFIILSTDLVAVDAIDVDVFASVWNLVPVVHLLVSGAECVLVAKDALNWDISAHVLQVEVIFVLPKGPPFLILLKLIVEVHLAHVLHVFDAALARAPGIVWKAKYVGSLQANAF